MRPLYPASLLLAGALLALGLPGPACAQQVAPDSATAAPAPRWLFKGGLALTRLRYTRAATSWQLLVPTALGIERRLTARYSLYGQLDTDWQVGSSTRRRSAGGMATAVPGLSLALGGRFYYGQPAGPAQLRPGRPELGRYLALEATAASEQATATRAAPGQRAAFTPALYVLWGTQNRLRAHALYDLNLGVGVLAPTRAAAESPLAHHGWDVGAQANLRVYLAR